MPVRPSHPLASIFRALGSLLPRSAADRPRPTDADAQVIRPRRDDFARRYPTVGLTPAKLLAYLQAADAGTPQVQFELFAEMLQKWPRLAAVEATRRLALTGLDWEISPTQHAGVRSTQHDDAARAADLCNETLQRLDNLREILDHLATAIAFGISVVEIVWDRGRLADLIPVPHSRLIADPHEPWRLRVRTADHPNQGVPLDAAPTKWIVHKPRATPGRHFDGGLLRASVLLYLAQNLSFKDWLVFSQIAGMPVRVAQFDRGTPEADKQELLRMLEKLGTDAVAIFNKSVELRFLEAGNSPRPYQPLQDYCNNEITILWLGQHLTTDIKSSGSRAAAEVHDRVREDLLVDDIGDESHTLRRDLLTPLVRAQLGSDAPVPQFRRSLVQSVDTKVLADTLAVAVNELGLRVPARWVHQALGIPEPQADEAVLTTEESA